MKMRSFDEAGRSVRPRSTEAGGDATFGKDPDVEFASTPLCDPARNCDEAPFSPGRVKKGQEASATQWARRLLYVIVALSAVLGCLYVAFRVLYSRHPGTGIGKSMGAVPRASGSAGEHIQSVAASGQGPRAFAHGTNRKYSSDAPFGHHGSEGPRGEVLTSFHFSIPSPHGGHHRVSASSKSELPGQSGLAQGESGLAHEAHGPSAASHMQAEHELIESLESLIRSSFFMHHLIPHPTQGGAMSVKIVKLGPRTEDGAELTEEESVLEDIEHQAATEWDGVTSTDLDLTPLGHTHKVYRLPFSEEQQTRTHRVTMASEEVHICLRIELTGIEPEHTAIAGGYVLMLADGARQRPHLLHGRIMYHKPATTSGREVFVYYDHSQHRWNVDYALKIDDPQPIAFLPKGFAVPFVTDSAPEETGVHQLGPSVTDSWFVRTAGGAYAPSKMTLVARWGKEDSWIPMHYHRVGSQAHDAEDDEYQEAEHALDFLTHPTRLTYHTLPMMHQSYDHDKIVANAIHHLQATANPLIASETPEDDYHGGDDEDYYF